MRNFRSKISKFVWGGAQRTLPTPHTPHPSWPSATRRPRPLSRNPGSVTVCGYATDARRSLTI